MREVENAVWESHDYVSCQEQTSKHKGYWKSKEMSIKNIMMTSHSRILKQQREVIQESTQIGYQNNELFKEALRWAIEMMKMSKLRILSNDKKGLFEKALR